MGEISQFEQIQGQSVLVAEDTFLTIFFIGKVPQIPH